MHHHHHHKQFRRKCATGSRVSNYAASQPRISGQRRSFGEEDLLALLDFFVIDFR